MRDRGPAAAVAARQARPERDDRRASTRCRRDDRAAGQHRALRVPDDGRHRDAARAARRLSTSCVRVRRKRLPRVALVLPGGRRGRAAVGRRADRRLGHDRGRPPAVGRLRRDAHRPRPSPAPTASRSATRRSRSSTSRSPSRSRGCCGGCAACPLARRGARGACSLTDAAADLRSLAGLAAYAVLAGADFGAGFWPLLVAAGASAARVRDHAHHAMGPVWEANHVWLIFVLVVCWTALPDRVRRRSRRRSRSRCSSPRSGSSCAAPPTRCARGRDGARATRSTAVFALSSILTPFALGAAVGGIASGRVPVGNAAGDLWSSWLNADRRSRSASSRVAMSAYLAAVYLAADAARLGDAASSSGRSARARWSTGVVAGALALAALIVRARRRAADLGRADERLGPRRRWSSRLPREA